MTQHPMAWIERFTCDVCGKQQMSVDEKWWIAVNECASTLDSTAGQPTLKLMPWDNALAHSAESKHLCGAGCAHTFMDRWMADFRAGTETCVDVSTTS
jgi:hypothetical protein